MQEKDQSTPTKNVILNVLSWKVFLFISFLFAVVTIIIYSPSLNGDFVFDDKIIKYNYHSLIHITKASQLEDILLSKEHARRIGLTSFALNYYFGGLDTLGYHLVNVIIHILNGLVLFFLSYTILTLPTMGEQARGTALKIAFLGSFTWLVHPIQTQAVSYIVQRLTSLSTLFFLLSLLCYIKGRVNHTHKSLALFILSVFFGLLALGTKQNTATLPLFIILSEFFFFQQHSFQMDKKKWGLVILLTGLFILIAGIYLGSDFISRWAQTYKMRGWTPLERVLTQLRVIILYINLLFYPHPSRLNVDHDLSISSSLFSPFTTFLSLLFIIGLLILAIFLIRRNCLVSYALFWFFGNLVIESSIIPLVLVFEHRLYLPSMGLIILIVGLCVRIPKIEFRKWGAAVVVFLILLFSYWTYERTFVWRGPVSLWLDAAKKSPYKTRPLFKLGDFYLKKGKLDEAIAKYGQVLNIDPNYAEAHNNLGVAYYKKGRLDDAISEYKQALTIHPNYAMFHKNLGLTYVKKGELDEAILEFKKALAINPNYAIAHFGLGVSYHNKGNYQLAIAHCDKAIKLGHRVDPNFLKLLKPHR